MEEERGMETGTALGFLFGVQSLRTRLDTGSHKGKRVSGWKAREAREGFRH